MRITSALKLSAAAFAVSAAAFATASQARTLHWAYQTDVASLDPMTLNVTFTLGFQGNFYETLFGYDKDLKLVPVLAESWSNPEPTKWVIKLRQGVKFHDGSPFTADDVIFSWQRSLTPGSNMKGFGAKATDVKKIDDYTVEIDTPSPNPILPRDWTWLFMMSKSWAEKNGATQATDVRNLAANYANLHENGTGPFMVADREPDVKTVLKRFDGYWNKANLQTNVDEVVFQPIKQESTRVAALVSGEMDIVQPVPVQDWERLKGTKGIKVLSAPEIRAIFIGFDQWRDELVSSSVKGKNPFKDVRVREAVVLAVDTAAINQKLMRGAAKPLGSLVSTALNGYDDSFGAPIKADVNRAKKLMAEAGYPDGFEVAMNCPNDRYVNDEKICQAVAGMLARIGIKIDLRAETASKFFATVKLDPKTGSQTSMYLLGWSANTVDADNTLFNAYRCIDFKAGAGMINYGGYCNKEVDELEKRISVETDQAKRNELIKQAFLITRKDWVYLPLHQQPMSWGVKDTLKVAQRADDVLDLRYVVMP
jgi:peptide/nickel transport system substrate-binding protein